MKNEIKEILEELINSNIIDSSTIPNIDLYVDQLTTFIEDNSFSNTEKNLTKSMVNNYCKNKIIPSSTKKKYNKSHIMYLIIIYNTKSIISISDIKKIFDTFSEEDLINYYNITTNLMLDFNNHFYERINSDIDKILSNDNLDSDKKYIAILATKLAIEANTKKIFAELLISKFL